MKGTLQKTEQGWVVEYRADERTPIGHKSWWEKLPLHPGFIEMMDTCFTSKFSQEVEFEIVKEYTDSHTNQVQKYAKLINHSVNTKETLYTEEQVLEAMKFARTFSNAIRDIDYIQSLKQPKL